MPDLTAKVGAGLRARLRAYVAETERSPSNRRTRDLSSAALAALMLDGNATLAEDYLRRAYAAQDMDPASHSYGQLKWITTDAKVLDFNAVEFNSMPLGPILLRYRKDLSTDFLEEMKPHLAASLAALRHHRVDVGYTNIWLMNTASLMMLAEAVHDDGVVAESEKYLDRWIDYTRIHGITEFDSPTYYFCDLAGLVEGYRYAPTDRFKLKIKVALDYVWTDIAANYFAPAQKLAGPYSRDYDFLHGLGMLDFWLGTAGWLQTDPFKVVDLDGCFVLDNLREGGYVPSPSATALAHSGARFVQSNWTAAPNHPRWAWLGQHIQIGCTSGEHGDQDKMFTAIFAGPRDQAEATLEVDAHDAPYGLYRQRDRANHPKPVHLQSHPVAVQSGSTILMTVDIDPSKLPEDAAGLTTNIVLPNDGTIAVDDKSVSLAAPGQIAVNPQSVVTVSVGGGSLGIRLLKAEALNGIAPTLSLAADAVGLEHHAVRLRLSHLEPHQTAAAKHLHIVLLLSAADTDQPATLLNDLHRAEMQESISGDTWHITANLPHTSLEVARSLAKPDDISALRIDGTEVKPALLSVNGADLAGPIWQQLP